MDNTDISTLRCLRCGNYWGSNCGPEENFKFITRFCPICVQIVSDSHLDLAPPPPPINPRRPMTTDMFAVYELDRGFKIKCRGKKWSCYAPRHSGVGERSTARQGWWYPATGREAAKRMVQLWMLEQNDNRLQVAVREEA